MHYAFLVMYTLQVCVLNTWIVCFMCKAVSDLELRFKFTFCVISYFGTTCMQGSD